MKKLLMAQNPNFSSDILSEEPMIEETPQKVIIYLNDDKGIRKSISSNLTF